MNHQNSTEEEKRWDKEQRKLEVRKRLEEEAKAKLPKKGFMTAERKKKLRNLMRQKAAEELIKDRERRAEERNKIISERAGDPKNLEVSQEKLIDICNEYHERIKRLEDEKYDLQFETRKKDMILTEFNMHLQDLKGKFVKPNLKKVRNYELKLEKMEMAAKKVDRDLRGNLKKVKSGQMNNFEDISGASSPATPGSANWDAKKQLN